MPKEMLFLCDIYTKWLEENDLPHQCASDILYGKDTMNRLTLNQTYWLENFISTWDVIAQYAQENQMTNLSPKIIDELKSFLVERVVDNMSTKDLVAYVTDDLDRYYEKMSDVEFLDEAQNYWEDHFDDVIEEIEEYADCDFKKDRREDYYNSLSEGKD